MTSYLETLERIEPLGKKLENEIQNHLDFLTKPQGNLKTW